MSGNQGKLRALEAQEEARRLSKEELLKPRKVQKEVEIAGLEGTVKIQTISYQKRRELRQECKWNTPQYDDEEFTLGVVAESVIEPKLTREDLKELAEQDALLIDMLSMEINTLNLLGKAEELKKDSSPTTNSDSA